MKECESTRSDLNFEILLAEIGKTPCNHIGILKIFPLSKLVVFEFVQYYPTIIIYYIIITNYYIDY